MPERMIITAASELFGPSAVALVGSLNLNWPDHPPVRVYDIGMDDETLATLTEGGVDVVRVPAFVPHWRLHFTWKIWCWNDAPARDVIWMDAGIVALRPLSAVLTALDGIGYFVLPAYHELMENASVATCEGCGVPPEFRAGKMTIAAGMAAFRKEGTVGRILEEALEVALTERYIEATEPLHRHDQAVLSLLMYKHLGDPILGDGRVYLGWESPRQAPAQKLWVHRRSLSAADQAHFTAHVSRGGAPHMPEMPEPPPVVRPTLRHRVGRVVHGLRGHGEEPLPGVTVPYDGIRA